jgi:hypothetical protein
VVLARGLNSRVPLTRRDRPLLAVSPDGGWLLAIVSHAALGGRTTDEELTDCTLYVAPRGGLADPASWPWRRVAGVEDGVIAYALTEDPLDLVSGRDAPRYQALAVPLADPDPDRARVVVPPGPRVVQAVKAAGDHLLVRDLDAGVAGLRRVALDGGEPEDLALPVQGTILEWAVTNALRAEIGANGPINVPGHERPALRDLAAGQDGRPPPAATASGRPVLLRIDAQAGHGFGSTASQRDSLLADELAFLLDQLGTAVAPRW